MTRDEILAMAPGEELDALVAECVVGLKRGVDFGEFPEHQWQRNEDGKIDAFAFEAGYHNGPMCARCGYSYCEHCQDGPTEPCVVKPEPYSRSASAALRIVPAMGERGWDCATYYEADAGCWTVYFLNARLKPADARAQSSSLAEALCKAALLAMLEEGEGA